MAGTDRFHKAAVCAVIACIQCIKIWDGHKRVSLSKVIVIKEGKAVSGLLLKNQKELEKYPSIIFKH